MGVKEDNQLLNDYVVEFLQTEEEVKKDPREKKKDD